MPRLRQLSGPDVVAILESFGFFRVSQRGSHVKLRRLTAGGAAQTLLVPLHRQLDTGTLRAIVRQASAFVPEDDLRSKFYAD